MTPFERQVRAAVYQSFRDTGDGPDVEDLSTTLSASSDDVRTALRALAAEHCLVLKPGTDDIWMAHPFSAVPTDFVVTIGERRFFANCGWDAFAILAMLGEGAFETHCRATKVPLRFEAKSGIVQGAGILHFLVPPRQFWDDIGFT